MYFFVLSFVLINAERYLPVELLVYKAGKGFCIGVVFLPWKHDTKIRITVSE